MSDMTKLLEFGPHTAGRAGIPSLLELGMLNSPAPGEPLEDQATISFQVLS